MTKWNIIIGGCIGIFLGWGLLQLTCGASPLHQSVGRMMFFALGVLLYDWALRKKEKI